MKNKTLKGNCPLCGAPIILDEYTDDNYGCVISYTYDYEWAVKINADNNTLSNVPNTYGGGH